MHRKCLLVTGVEDASKDALPTQQNKGQGLASARVVPAVCVWDTVKGSATRLDKQPRAG